MLAPCASTWQLHAIAYVLVCIATVVRRPSAAIVIVRARTPDLLISTISDSSQFMRNSYKGSYITIYQRSHRLSYATPRRIFYDMKERKMR